MISKPMPSIAACVLAAGKGTRMRSRLVKVLHPFLGRPMVTHIVDAAFRAGVDRVITVIGHQADAVRQSIEGHFPGWSLGFAQQLEQRGTGHAVSVAMPVLEGAGHVLICYGDTPLLSMGTLRQLLELHRESGNVMTLTTFVTPDPTGYGRIVRDKRQRIVRIVEHADATPAELALHEVNAGVYVVQGDALSAGLATLTPHNNQGELYLTDLVERIATKLIAESADGSSGIGALVLQDGLEAMGINTRAQLAELEEIYQKRLRKTWMDRGVTMQDPHSIRIDLAVDIGEDTTLGPNVQLLGKTRIGIGCSIDAGALLEDCELGDFVHVKPYTVAVKARLASAVEVGPFAHLRAGTELGEQSKIGNFVETKKARFGPHAKASHLSYLGDCDIGRHVNIGAGTITCNYDGVDKHRTVIEDGVFVGSDSQFVAPVHIGKNATIGAGTTVVKDVPEGALALARSPQENRLDYYERRRRPREEKKRVKVRSASLRETEPDIAPPSIKKET